MQRIIRQASANLAQSYVVGDRVKKEIAFGNKMGMRTMWMRNDLLENEMPATAAETPHDTVTSIKEVLSIIT